MKVDLLDHTQISTSRNSTTPDELLDNNSINMTSDRFKTEKIPTEIPTEKLSSARFRRARITMEAP